MKTAWDESFEAQSSTNDSLIIDVQKWINYVSFDSIGQGGFSHDFGAVKGDRSAVLDALDSFGKLKHNLFVTSIFLIGLIFPTFVATIPNMRSKKTRALSRGVKEIAGELLEKAEREKALGVEGLEKSIIGTLVKSESASERIHMSVDEIMAQINLLIIAGYETTSVTITWALIELSRHPEMQEALRAELRQSLRPNEDPTYDQLTNGLPYLDAFTSELLRLHPAAPELNRVATEDDFIPLAQPIITASGESIERIFVPKGTFIRIPLVGVNQSEALWGPDVRKFDPTRWLESGNGKFEGSARKEEVQGYKHLLTFGFGPRMCLGRNFALTELKAVLSVLVRNYSFELPNGPETKVETHRSILLRPRIAGEEGPKVPLVVRKIVAE